MYEYRLFNIRVCTTIEEVFVGHNTDLRRSKLNYVKLN